MPEGAEGVGGVTDEAAVVEVDGGLDVGLEGVVHGDDVAAEAADFAPPFRPLGSKGDWDLETSLGRRGRRRCWRW